MKKSIYVITVVLVVVFALIFTSVTPKPSAIAAPIAEENVTTTLNISKAAQDAASAFWTKDAMVNAEAMVMPVDFGPSGLDVFAMGQEEALGTPGSSSAGAARPNANAIARKAYPSEWVNTGQTDPAAEFADEMAGTSEVFTSFYGNYKISDWRIYPHRWVGRLSFRTSGGTSYCSATAISKNHIVTAAHCVYDTTNNVWYSNWRFTPAYRNGSAPYGSFSASSCTILTAWKNLSGSFSINGWTKYDLAVCNVGLNSAGKTLNQMVGWAGRLWNASYTKNIFNLGYPFKNTSNVYLPNAGQYLRICTAESRQQTTDTLGMGCNYGGGISGGPWLVRYAPTFALGYVNSVNSGLYVGQMNLYGIRFTSNNIVLICDATGC